MGKSADDMPAKSIKLYWNEESINNGDVLACSSVRGKETLEAAKTLIAQDEDPTQTSA